MYESEIIEYTNRHKMEETTAKVLARLHHMKSFLSKTTHPTYSTPLSFEEDNQLETTISLPLDTISTISIDSIDSGVSTLSDFSHNSFSSSTLLLNRTAVPKSKTSHLRCDPSIINYLSHNLLNSHHSESYFDDTPSIQIPLAESSRRSIHDQDQTMVIGDEDDETCQGPLTSTMIDRWYSVTKPYQATFRQDLTVRKNELVQVLRSTHPHWVWIRNELNQEGFVPTDCLMNY